MTREQRAMAYFEEGYNCSQAVVLAFAPEIGLPPEMLARLASSFGGGMGRMREVCGAVSGMFLVAGFLYGYADAKAREEKTAHYARIQELARRFKEENGQDSIVCRELLGAEGAHTDPRPEERTEAYYRKRPCKELVGIAARVLDRYLSENGK